MSTLSWPLVRALWQSYWRNDDDANRIVAAQQAHYWEYRAELLRQQELQQRLLTGRATLQDTSEVVSNVWAWTKTASADFLHDNLAIWPTLLLILVWIYPQELFYGGRRIVATLVQVYGDLQHQRLQLQQQWQALQKKLPANRKNTTPTKTPQGSPTSTAPSTSILRSSLLTKDSSANDTLPSQSLSHRDLQLSPQPPSQNSSRVKFQFASPNQTQNKDKRGKVKFDHSFFGDSYTTDISDDDDNGSNRGGGPSRSSASSGAAAGGIPRQLTVGGDPLGGVLGFASGISDNEEDDSIDSGGNIHAKVPTNKPTPNTTKPISKPPPAFLKHEVFPGAAAVKPFQKPRMGMAEEAFPGVGPYNPNKYNTNRPKFKPTLDDGYPNSAATPMRGMGFGTRTSFTQLDTDADPLYANTTTTSNNDDHDDDDDYFEKHNALSAKQQLAKRLRRQTSNPQKNNAALKNGVLQSMLDPNVPLHTQHGSAIPEDEEVDPSPQAKPRVGRKSSVDHKAATKKFKPKSSLNQYRRSSVDPKDNKKNRDSLRRSNSTHSSESKGSLGGTPPTNTAGNSSRRSTKKSSNPRKSTKEQHEMRNMLGYE